MIVDLVWAEAHIVFPSNKCTTMHIGTAESIYLVQQSRECGCLDLRSGLPPSSPFLHQADVDTERIWILHTWWPVRYATKNTLSSTKSLQVKKKDTFEPCQQLDLVLCKRTISCDIGISQLQLFPSLNCESQSSKPSPQQKEKSIPFRPINNIRFFWDLRAASNRTFFALFLLSNCVGKSRICWDQMSGNFGLGVVRNYLIGFTSHTKYVL